MKAVDSFKDYVVGDVLGHIDGITAKRMFGGYGLYLNGAIFAFILSDGELYYKADATTCKQYEDLGGTQFVYHGHHNKKPTKMPYWKLPEEIMEDREVIEGWTREAAALSTKK